MGLNREAGRAGNRGRAAALRQCHQACLQRQPHRGDPLAHGRLEWRARDYRPAPRASRRRRSVPVCARPPHRGEGDEPGQLPGQRSPLGAGQVRHDRQLRRPGRGDADRFAAALPGGRVAGWPIDFWDRAAATATTAAACARRSAMAPKRIFLLTMSGTVLMTTTPWESILAPVRWQACCRGK